MFWLFMEKNCSVSCMTKEGNNVDKQHDMTSSLPFTHFLGVVHDALVVIRDTSLKIRAPPVLPELVSLTRQHVIHIHIHIVVTVGPRVLMPEPDGMAQLVEDDSHSTAVPVPAVAQVQRLSTSNHPDVCFAPVGKRGESCE